MSEYEQALARFVADTRAYVDGMRALEKTTPRLEAPEYTGAARETVRACRALLLEALNEMPNMRVLINVPVI